MNTERPTITDEQLKDYLDYVLQRKDAAQRSGWIDMGTIRDQSDLAYACQAVEGTHYSRPFRKEDGEFRIARRGETVYGRN